MAIIEKSMLKAITEPKGQSKVFSIKCSTLMAIVDCASDPRSAGVAYDPKVHNEAKIQPAAIPGTERGRVTLRKVLMRPAPRLRAASFNDGS
ncbi:unnamed protein product, partial [marine sediment metagenome]